MGGIPNDIEDTLLPLRLYQPGDICFVKQTIVAPSGSKSVQFPYGSMNDLNSYSLLPFKIEPHGSEQCGKPLRLVFEKALHGTPTGLPRRDDSFCPAEPSRITPIGVM